MVSPKMTILFRKRIISFYFKKSKIFFGFVLDFGSVETINKKSSVIPTQVSLFVSRRTQINDRQEALQSDSGMFQICEANS